eukprot:15653319-Heterocapsa_arctica.AAC.1
MAMMQGAVAAMQAGQMDVPRDRERDDTRMNHHAARGLQPAHGPVRRITWHSSCSARSSPTSPMRSTQEPTMSSTRPP